MSNSGGTNSFPFKLRNESSNNLKIFIKNRKGINATDDDIKTIKGSTGTRLETKRAAQTGTYEKYKLHKINTHYGLNINNGRSSANIDRTKVRRKTEDFLPWPLVKILRNPATNIRNLNVIKDTIVPSLIGNYKLSYVQDVRFPTVILDGYGSKKLRSSQVGLFCKKPGSAEISGFCSRKETFKAIGTNSNTNVYKKGMRGLSIADVTKLVKKGTNNPKIFGNHEYMALMYELKRVGDASQIYYARQLNSSEDKITIKPYDSELMSAIKRYSSGGSSDDMLRNILLSFHKDTKNFYYKNAIFWSNDRAACLLAYILKVPFILRPQGRGNMWLVKPRNMNVNRKNFNENTILGDIFSGNDENMWIRKLAIVDTYHDFASTFSKSQFNNESPYSLGNILKNAIKSSYSTTIAEELSYFIDSNFKDKSAITKHETVIGNFLKTRAVNPQGTSSVEELADICKRVFGNAWKHYCVIHDAGTIGGIFTKRRAMSPAIIYDPATSQLNTYNTSNRNTRNNGKDNKTNSLNDYNILRANNIRALNRLVPPKKRRFPRQLLKAKRPIRNNSLQLPKPPNKKIDNTKNNNNNNNPNPKRIKRSKTNASVATNPNVPNNLIQSIKKTNEKLPPNLRISNADINEATKNVTKTERLLNNLKMRVNTWTKRIIKEK